MEPPNGEPSLSDLTARCIRCGFCLESCPTFALDGDESRSPRGRIALTQAADAGEIAWADIKEPIDTCLGCRACETACPSGVQYGSILEVARAKVGTSKPRQAALSVLTNPTTAKIAIQLGNLAGSVKIPSFVGLSIEPPQANAPRIQPPSGWNSLVESELVPIRGEVYLLTGCLSSTIFPRVEEAVVRLLRRVGFVVRPVETACCGALLAHAGMVEQAQAKAGHLSRIMSGQLPVVVHTAGCGSAMKDYGHLGLGDLASRVQDISEFLLAQGLIDQLRNSSGLKGLTVTYHDACHLAHGQKIRSQPRELLKSIPGINWVELEESDMCCGSAGTYNLFEPTTAKRLLDRKWSNINATKADVVVQGNAGCHGWLDQASRESGETIRVLHTAELLEASFSGLP